MTGAKHDLYLIPETAYGVQGFGPTDINYLTDNIRPVPHNACSVAMTRANNVSQNKNESSRERKCNDRGVQRVSGDISFELNQNWFEYWLKSAMCATSRPDSAILDFNNLKSDFHFEQVSFTINQIGAASVYFGHAVLFNVDLIDNPAINASLFVSEFNDGITLDAPFDQYLKAQDLGGGKVAIKQLNIDGVDRASGYMISSSLDNGDFDVNDFFPAILENPNMIRNAGVAVSLPFSDSVSRFDDRVVVGEERSSFTLIRRYIHESGLVEFEVFTGCEVNQFSGTFKTGDDTKSEGSVTIMGQQRTFHGDNTVPEGFRLESVIDNLNHARYIQCPEPRLLQVKVDDIDDIIPTELTLTIANNYEAKNGLNSDFSQRPSLKYITVSGNVTVYYDNKSNMDLKSKLEEITNNSFSINCFNNRFRNDGGNGLFTVPNDNTLEDVFEQRLELNLRNCVSNAQTDVSGDAEVVMNLPFTALSPHYESAFETEPSAIEISTEFSPL